MDIGEKTVSAVRKIGGSQGVSVVAVKQYLSLQMNETPDLETVQSSLNNAVDKGILSKLSNGNYIIKETTLNAADEAKEAIEEAKCAFEDVLSKMDNMNDKMAKFQQAGSKGKDEIEKIALLAEEATQDAKDAVDELPAKIDKWNEKFKEFVQDTSSKLGEIKEKIKDIPTQQERVTPDTNQEAGSDLRNAESPATKVKETTQSQGNEDKDSLN